MSMSTIDTIINLIDDALAAETTAVEAIDASTRALSGSSEELACLQAAEDLLERAHTIRTQVDEFWAGISDWQWDENDIVSVRTGLRGSPEWMRS